ncbi:hypothetical protein CANCADRAFT_20180, partial [Tortispora caseinolytica NRRL Y-17796]
VNAELRPYQSEGVDWLVSLYENGLNGILADEMGLGKTLQTIAFIAYLIEQGVSGPYLVVCPLSVVENWISEIQKFAPDLVPVVKYHGVKTTRTKLLRKLRTANIVITSYEMIIKDAPQLRRIPWRFVIVDEGHRIKNLNCKLIQDLKSFDTANRLLLTGTPLQNNLAELWSLLNFLLPDIFPDLALFQSWFDFSGPDSSIAVDASSDLIQSLHSILKPFVLRRVKSAVERDVPAKREYVLYAPLTDQQRNLYNAILDGNIRDVLKAKLEQMVTEYVDDGKDSSITDINATVKAEMATKRLQNRVMQLRLACNSPHLFISPWLEKDPAGAILNQSGKIQVLDSLVMKLLADNHKVLIFSQFSKMLDLIEIWSDYKGLETCRIDGSVSQEDRVAAINTFNESDEHKVFLLSTRAGGLGLNLVAADTVILLDSDWNPQVDKQAIDRVHRIGQTKPVLVFRLATVGTVEHLILDKANAKFYLEKLVIQ